VSAIVWDVGLHQLRADLEVAAAECVEAAMDEATFSSAAVAQGWQRANYGTGSEPGPDT
jgi:hypothetical protein